MIVLPIGDLNPRRTRPVVHYLIMSANVVVFLSMLFSPDGGEGMITKFGLVRDDFHWYQLFTSLFLHSGIAHLAFNMLFLYIVGDNVEDRLGHLGYLLFYLAVGVAAGLGFLLTVSPEEAGLPCVGASGAISGVMAAYVVFFPNSRIRILWGFFIFFRIAYVSAKWAIGLWFAQQILFSILVPHSGIAYGAHIGGFVAGLIFALPVRRLLHKQFAVPPDAQPGEFRPYESYDRLSWQEPVDADHTPREAPPQAIPLPVSSDELARELEHAVAAGQAERAFAACELFHRHGLAAPADLLYQSAGLMVEHNDYARAARLYRDYLENYPAGEHIHETRFRLGIISARVLNDFAQARTLLRRVAEEHPNSNRRNLARQELLRMDALSGPV